MFPPFWPNAIILNYIVELNWIIRECTVYNEPVAIESLFSYSGSCCNATIVYKRLATLAVRTSHSPYRKN